MANITTWTLWDCGPNLLEAHSDISMGLEGPSRHGQLNGGALGDPSGL